VVHTSVVPVGGDQFTNDLSVVLKTPSGEAERIKKKYGAALSALVSETETVDVPLVGERGVRPEMRRRIADILQARGEELLSLIWEEATRDHPAEELRAGLVLTGGGAELNGLLDLAEQVLGASSVRKGTPRGLGGLSDLVSGAEFSAGAGLLVYRQSAGPSPRNREKPTRSLFWKWKTSLKGMFPASAV
jgi:cell division protein FtsA